MITIDVKAEDFEGQVFTESCQFHLNKVELTELNLKYDGGIVGEMKRIEADGDTAKMFDFIKQLMILGYGRKSDNGKTFIKTKEITDEFQYGVVMPECLIQLLEDESGLAVFKFIRGMMPASAQQEIDRSVKSNPSLSAFAGN